MLPMPSTIVYVTVLVPSGNKVPAGTSSAPPTTSILPSALTISCVTVAPGQFSTPIGFVLASLGHVHVPGALQVVILPGQATVGTVLSSTVISNVHSTVLQPSSAVKISVVVPNGKVVPDGIFAGSAVTVTASLQRSFATGVL